MGSSFKFQDTGITSRGVEWSPSALCSLSRAGVSGQVAGAAGPDAGAQRAGRGDEALRWTSAREAEARSGEQGKAKGTGIGGATAADTPAWGAQGAPRGESEPGVNERRTSWPPLSEACGPLSRPSTSPLLLGTNKAIDNLQNSTRHSRLGEATGSGGDGGSGCSSAPARAST